jgi:hypothetical protein
MGPSKRFGNVALIQLEIESDDTTVGVLLHADTSAFYCTEPAYFSDVNIVGDVDSSSGDLQCKDIEIVSGGSLTIAAFASVDCDATTVAFAKIAVDDFDIGSSGSLDMAEGSSLDCDATDVSFGVTSTALAFNLSGVPEYTSQAAAQAAEAVGNVFYMGTDGVLSITLSP